MNWSEFIIIIRFNLGKSREIPITTRSMSAIIIIIIIKGVCHPWTQRLLELIEFNRLLGTIR